MMNYQIQETDLEIDNIHTSWLCLTNSTEVSEVAKMRNNSAGGDSPSPYNSERNYNSHLPMARKVLWTRMNLG